MSTLNFINMKVNTKMYLYLIPLALLLLIGNCSKDFTGINGNNNDIPCPVPTDTTSHEFTWVVDTLGDYGSSLKDVAIISENEVWVVGEIVINQPSYNLYGAAIWDGVNWQFKKLISGTTNVDPEGILAFTEDDIWLASGSIYHWNGDTTELSYLRNIGSGEIIKKLWGTSRNNIYGIGNDGVIIQFDGTTWTHQASGTSRDLNDITGITDPKTGKTRIWIAGTQVLLYSEDGENWQVIFDENSTMFPDGYVNSTTVYIPDECFIYVTVFGSQGTGLFRIDQRNFNDFELLSTWNFGIRGIDANAQNDILMAGSYNGIAHYNGKTIKTFPELSGDGFFRSVALRYDFAFIVGLTGNSFRGVVARGIR